MCIRDSASTVSLNYLTGATADAGTARDYALYRCAEIALERGFDGFVVLKGGAFSTSGPYGTTTVSYPHLRAHETVLAIVCRLLLEKKQRINESVVTRSSTKGRTPTITN